MVGRLVLVRNGESQVASDTRLSGWLDLPLTETGEAQVRAGARNLALANLTIDVSFASLLKRAVKSLHIILEETDNCHVPVHKSWRLNDRNYGSLEGLCAAETAAKHGEEQTNIWRQAYNIPPPALEKGDPRFPGNNPKYSAIPRYLLPVTESIADTVCRLLPYWFDTIAPELLADKNVLVVSHNSALGGLMQQLDHISEKEVASLEMPPGVPLVYSFEPTTLVPKTREFLTPS